MPQGLHRDAVAAWCARWLGAKPTQMLFEIAPPSVMAGLRLTDGREVVVKARPPAASIPGCVDVHRHLWAAGFSCPEPLAGPTPLGALTATAAAFVPGGVSLAPGPASPRRCAAALAARTRLAPSVASVPRRAPPPAWGWRGHGQPGPRPLPDDHDTDLSAHPEPAWLEDVGRRVRRRLALCHAAPVVGQADWEEPNIRWSDRHLPVVHDWESLVSRPEAVSAGVAAAVCRGFGGPGTAMLADTAAFPREPRGTRRVLGGRVVGQGLPRQKRRVRRQWRSAA